MKKFKELGIVKRSLKQDKTPYALWGAECDKGWDKIIVETVTKLDKLPDNELYITQIKEKFGELRIYTSSYKEEIEKELDSIIKEAEEKASRTCESCGAEGKLRTKGWIQVLCDKCYGINNYGK